MASLSQFASTIARSDVARQNRFEAQITGPFGGMDYASIMLVESVEFPGQIYLKHIPRPLLLRHTTNQVMILTKLYRYNFLSVIGLPLHLAEV